MDVEENVSVPSPPPKGPRDSLSIGKKQMSVSNLLSLNGPKFVDLTTD